MLARAQDFETTVLIADPPWPHANGSKTNSGKSPKYPLMSLRELSALGPTVAQLAGGNAVMYMWATAPHLPGAIDTLRSWGFTYRSYLIWRKTRVAAGFWARSDAEICLIAERGRPCAPPAHLLPRTVFYGDREESGHSSKPSAVHELVEALWPEAIKLEIFARRRRSGWTSYGFDLGTSVTASGVEFTTSASQ